MLKEYYEIQTQIKALEAKLKDIRDKVIAKGTHSEKNYICEVREQSRRTISLLDIERGAPKLFMELDKDGFIKESTSYIVKVSQKGAA